MLAPALSPVTIASKWTVVILEAGLLHLACFTHGSCCSAYCTFKPITQTRYRQPLLRLCQSCADHSARPAGTACTPQRKHQRTAIVDSNKARTVCCTTQPSNPHPPQQPQQGADKMENCHAARKDCQQVQDRQTLRPAAETHTFTFPDSKGPIKCLGVQGHQGREMPYSKCTAPASQTAAAHSSHAYREHRHAHTPRQHNRRLHGSSNTQPLTQLLGPGCRYPKRTQRRPCCCAVHAGAKTTVARRVGACPAATRAASQHTRRPEAAAAGS
jgi:hypothetical protein